jgi:hypothetical protein
MKDFNLDIQTITNLVAYQQAMKANKAKVTEILQSNETALAPIIAQFYGSYTLYKITYSTLALEEVEDEEEAEFFTDKDGKPCVSYDWGCKTKLRATVETYDAYALSDQPGDDGYYTCYEDRYSRQGLFKVKFTRVVKIEKCDVLYDDLSGENNNVWLLPFFEVDNANVSRFGSSRSARIYYYPGTDVIALRQQVNAVITPLPPEPKYSDFGITDEQFRALRSLWNR